MYYTGYDPRTMEKVYVPINPHEKAMQRALIQYRNPKNYDLVYEALVKADRRDLIGFSKECLIKPRNIGYNNNNSGKPNNNRNSNNSGNKKTKKKTIRNIHKQKNK